MLFDSFAIGLLKFCITVLLGYVMGLARGCSVGLGVGVSVKGGLNAIHSLAIGHRSLILEGLFVFVFA